MDVFPPIWHGTLREHYLVLFAAAGGIALVAGMVGAWVGAFIGARRGARVTLNGVARSAEQELSAERMTQLVRAVDAIALEVERISEGQRFTSKLLAERAAADRAAAQRPPRAPGATTPH